MFDKEKRDWVISSDKSDRAIRRFKTKVEAAEVVKNMSANQGVGNVVHKKNGQFQKKK